MQQKFEREQLELAIGRLETSTAELIEAAHEVAVELSEVNGSVTSPHVLRAMRQTKHAGAVAAADRRFMGAVFRRPGWRRVGYSSEGSHCRPVSVWQRVGD